MPPGLLFLFVWGLLRWRKEVLAILPNQNPKHKARDPGWQLREIVIGIFFIAVGLLPYLYLPIAASTKPVLNWGDPSNLNNFLRVVLRSDYGTFSFTAAGVMGNRFQNLIVLGRNFYHSFTPVGIVLAILGIVWFIRRKRMEGIGFGLAFLFTGPIFAIFANPLINIPLEQGVFERFYILPGITFAGSVSF